MAKYTIPAFDATNAGTIAASIIAIPWDSARKLLPPRVTGANKVYLSLAVPTAANFDDGYPLGPNADDAELGEALVISNEDGAQSHLYVTATSASEVRTLT